MPVPAPYMDPELRPTAEERRFHSYMERTAEILDSAEGCRKTGEGAVFVGEEECSRALADLRRLDAGEDSRFVVDWHDESGNLLESFGLDEAGFETLVGHPPKSPAEYLAFDEAFWQRARATQQDRSEP